MDRNQRQLQRRLAANPGDLAAKARLRSSILRAAPANVGAFLVLDAQRDTGFIKQPRLTGVWQVRAMRIEGLGLRLMLRRVEKGALAPDDFTGPQPRNTLWLDASRISQCLVRVGAPELAAACPHCGQGMGAVCRRPSGRITAPHVARQEALAALLAPPERVEVDSRPPVDPEAARALRERLAARGFETTTRLDEDEDEDEEETPADAA